MIPQTLVGAGLVFPESPRWRDGRLWLSDMHAHRVLTVDMDGHVQVQAELDDKPSGIGFLSDGRPVVVLMRSRQVVVLDGPRASTYADLTALPGRELNDMVVGSEGRLYVGSRTILGRDRFTPRPPDWSWPDSIAMVDLRGRAETVARGVVQPNGLVLTPDGRRLLVAQTFGHSVLSFDVAADGSLSNRSLFADLENRTPDGMCLDAEGALWVACVQSGEFIRVHQGGRISDLVRVDGAWALSCILGGTERRTLFLVSAHTTLENNQRCTDFHTDKTSRARGRVDVVEVELPGAGWPT